MRESALLVGCSDGSYPLLMSCLCDLQLDVTEIPVGAKALEWLSLRHPAIVVCDLPLPDLPVSVFVSRAKRTKPTTSLVLVAGGERGPDLSQVVQLGADEYVPRPVDRPKLIIATARALNRHRTALQAAQTRLLRTLNASDQIVSMVVEALRQCLEAKDFLSDGHAETVSDLATRLAERIGLSERETAHVRLAALLHDLGKIAVDQLILERPRSLTAAEWREVQTHPVRGAEIVANIEPLRDVAVYIRHHHERHDGRGYPDGLLGDQIPLASRLISVADAYDAMVRPRPYRASQGITYAAKEFVRHAGTQWDKQAVDVLFACVPELRHAVG